MLVLINIQAVKVNLLRTLIGWLDLAKASLLKIKMAKANPINPPNLLGIERKTA